MLLSSLLLSSLLPPGWRCEAGRHCQRTPCFRLELRDAAGALYAGRAALHACAGHLGDAAKTLSHAAAGRGELAGGSIQVWAIDANQTSAFPFATISLDS
jgi:hypothetical protein